MYNFKWIKRNEKKKKKKKNTKKCVLFGVFFLLSIFVVPLLELNYMRIWDLIFVKHL